MRKILGVGLSLSLLTAAQPGRAVQSVEDMFLVEVPLLVSTSKIAVKQNRAPGTAYSFSGAELEARGITTLAQLLRQIPGSQVNPQRQGHQVAWFRGVQTRYNNKLLLLVDGVPMRDIWYGNFLLDEMHPVELIDRVEVVMGPGSVLYGTNAFGGVISITTKKASNDASFRYGPYAARGASGSAHLGDRVWISGEHLAADNGFSPHYGRDGLSRRLLQERDRELRILSGGVKVVDGLTVSASKTWYDYPLLYSKFERSSKVIREPQTLSAVFSRGSAESLKADVLLYHVKYPFRENETRNTSSGTNRPRRKIVDNRDTSYMGGDAYLTRILSRHTVLAGLSFMEDRPENTRVYTTDLTSPALTLTSYDQAAFKGKGNRSSAVYVQDVWSLTPGTDLTLGVRRDAVERFNDPFTWRVGLVRVTESDFSLKALYGTAFRTPSYREYQKLTETGGQSYDPHLQPEYLRTAELAVGKNWSRGNVLATVFHNHYRDYITDVFVASVADDVAFNLGWVELTGLELSGAVTLGDRLQLRPALTHTRSKAQGSKEPLHALAEWTGSLDAGVALFGGLSAGVTALLSGHRHVDAAYQSVVPVANRRKGLNGGFCQLNARLNWRLGRHFSLEVVGENVGNEKVYSPHFGPSTDWDLEWPGAQWRAAVRTKW